MSHKSSTENRVYIALIQNKVSEEIVPKKFRLPDEYENNLNVAFVYYIGRFSSEHPVIGCMSATSLENIEDMDALHERQQSDSPKKNTKPVFAKTPARKPPYIARASKGAH